MALAFLAFAALATTQTNFFIQDIQQNPGGSVTITWPAMPQWTYHVMSASSPTGTWQDFPNGQLTASTNTIRLGYTDTTAAAVSQRFYKVRTTRRATVIMTLVLDRSGSMNPGNGTTGGGAYLPGAVTSFLTNFNDAIDQAAMVSFATTATADVPMKQPFNSTISAAANNLIWCGGTFSQGGLTNALVQENSVFVPPGQNAIKVVVFFTDGLANIVQDALSCPTPTPWNFGGVDFGSGVFFFSTNAPDTCAGQNNGCYILDGGIPSSCGCNAIGFHSNQYNVMESFTRANVTAEAQYRTIQVAQQMQAGGIFVYSIGLGSGVDTNFLAQIANATNSPTYNPALPTGRVVMAATATNLKAAFQQIASQILSLASP